MISVVTAYYNRKNQFYLTLKSIAMSSVKDVEVIACDDASAPDQRIEGFVQEFPFLKILRIEPEQKTWTNPCIPYNRAIEHAQGDVVVLQNPECMHCGDILAVAQTMADNDYLSYGCMSLDPAHTDQLPNIIWNENWIQSINSIIPDPQRGACYDGDYAWYNHTSYRGVYYHFCNSIRRHHLIEMGGFDERFANGAAFDDDEFLTRIRRKGLNVQLVNSPYVAHQYHIAAHQRLSDRWGELVERNRALLGHMTNYESGFDWRVFR